MNLTEGRRRLRKGALVASVVWGPLFCIYVVRYRPPWMRFVAPVTGPLLNTIENETASILVILLICFIIGIMPVWIIYGLLAWLMEGYAGSSPNEERRGPAAEQAVIPTGSSEGQPGTGATSPTDVDSSWSVARFVFYGVAALATVVFIWAACDYRSASKQWVHNADSLFGAFAGAMRNRDLAPVVTRAFNTMLLSGPVATVSFILGLIAGRKERMSGASPRVSPEAPAFRPPPMNWRARRFLK